MAERGIIFCGEMVEAILDDRKTKTSRTEGLKVLNEHPEEWRYLGWSNEIPPRAMFYCPEGARREYIKPRYHVGDLLWVRETFYYRDILGNEKVPKLRPAVRHKITYKADDQHRPYVKWQSSRFMPKWAARIWLEVTGVKVERLQDINIEDAKAEGITEYQNGDHIYANRTSVENFSLLWNELHKKSGECWVDNPWVFVYEFKRIEKGD